MHNRVNYQQHLWEQLQPHGTRSTARRGTFIYQPTQAATCFYLLAEGRVHLQLLSSEGRALTVHVVEPGQMFGHSALTNSETYDTYAEAMSNVHVIVVPRETIFHVLMERPSIGLCLIDTIGRYRWSVSHRLDEVAFKSVPARLASLLLDMASGESDELASRVPHHTHQQLAEMINAYRETVTKVINQFRAAQLLDVDRSGITLLNPSGLRELSQS